MRTAFIKELIVQARLHPEVFLVVGDLGFSVVEPFASEFPERFLNAGVAEQNMTGVAAGLASEGFHVFTYSIANFPTLRCLEQIRNDICYHQLPVTVVSVGAGVAYGNLGYSHHAVQDIAILRTLPELTLLSPADPGEARESLQWLIQHPRPSYLRLGKAGEPDLHTVRGLSEGPLLVRPGTGNTAIVASGSILKLALETARLLGEKGFELPVFSLPWLHPCDAKLVASLSRFERIFVLEEHVQAGGVASLLRENLGGHPLIISLALPASVLGMVGSQDYLRGAAGLTSAELFTRIRGDSPN